MKPVSTKSALRFPAEHTAYSAFYGVSHMLCSLVSRVFFWRRILGLEHWIDGPALIAANHASFLDPPLIGSACPEQIAYLARHDLFHNVLFRAICYGVGAIPVERNAADFGSMKRVLSTLRRGKKVLLFPEGVRTYNGRMRKPMAGVGFLVARAGVPVIPTYIHGSYRAWPRHRQFPVPTQTIVAFGEPARYDALSQGRPTREIYTAIAEDIMARIDVLRRQALDAL